MRSNSLLESVGHATDGMAYVLHHHRHMRYHLLIAAVALLLSAILKVSRVELLLLVTAITLVVMAELANSAVEAVVDLASPEVRPLAKVAKDVSGGVVLAAVVGALLIGAGVFLKQASLEALQGAGTGRGPHFLHVALVGVVTVILAVILGKLWGRRGTLTKGGVVSAHSALASFCFVSVWFLTPDIVVRGLAFVLALLVAQSRVEAGIHTVREVLIGVVVALVIGIGMYGLLSVRLGG